VKRFLDSRSRIVCSSDSYNAAGLTLAAIRARAFPAAEVSDWTSASNLAELIA
jgi:hypothetical protein